MTSNDTLIADLIAAGVDPVLVGRVRAVIGQLKRVTLRHATELVTEPIRSDRPRRSNRSNRSNRSDEVEVMTDWPSDYPWRFWKAYPHKVGKADALKVLDRVLKRGVLWEALWAGLQRYVAKQDERPWCNPATWLRQERWLDEPADAPQRFAGRPPRPGSRDDQTERTHHALQNLRDYVSRSNDEGTGQ